MEQQPEPEKPFLLQQLLPHGILAAVLLLAGWLVPAQYNVLHPKVLRQAGADTETFQHFGSNAPSHEVRAVLNLSRLKIGSAGQDASQLPELKIKTALDEYLNPGNRNNAIDAFRQKGGTCRKLIELIPAVPEYGTALILAARLQDEGRIRPGIHQRILAHDPRPHAGKSMKELHSAELRQILHALLILGNRLSHEQLAELTEDITDPDTLKALAKIAKHQTMVPAFSLFDIDPASPGALTQANLAGISAIGEPELFERYDTNSSGLSKDTLTRDEWVMIGHVPLQYTDFPTTYAACVWSEDPRAVTEYLLRHGRRGDRHLQKALNQGRGALALVLERQLPVSSLNTPALETVASFCYHHPRWALAVKYILIGLGCLVLMRTWSSFFTVTASDVVSLRAYRMRRRTVSFALFLTLVAFSEPVLFAPVFSSEYQVPINLPLAAVDSTETPNPTETMLASNSVPYLSIIFIVIFAAIQAFIYYACVSKIKDVQNGEGDPKLKLQLLENEDNLFDTGLYVGIAGTALMLAILIIAPSWNISVSAAYASNIFGILCVAVVKIFHVRGTRQMLILEAEAAGGSTTYNQTP
jgi:hypothetical protein